MILHQDSGEVMDISTLDKGHGADSGGIHVVSYVLRTQKGANLVKDATSSARKDAFGKAGDSRVGIEEPCAVKQGAGERADEVDKEGHPSPHSPVADSPVHAAVAGFEDEGEESDSADSSASQSPKYLPTEVRTILTDMQVRARRPAAEVADDAG